MRAGVESLSCLTRARVKLDAEAVGRGDAEELVVSDASSVRTQPFA
ncbi:hypothetical protein RISK_002913 [Rhodopirellula islandica]|uniref:Uncharacterized protein n=1 Tax=Rhodopirellula islandica TaxID=595434 RepID=A0A0J1BF61_RHOIS|nr:hypothetical protein RISK_002913 [Rhodopirellula islandica]